MSDSLKDELVSRLNAMNVYELRQLGRSLGVPHPTSEKKEWLIENIMAVASGTENFKLPSKRGRQAVSDSHDRELAIDILRYRENRLSEQVTDEENKPKEIFVGNADRNSLDYVDSGILEYSGNKWFLRTTGCRENLSADVFVNEYFVKTYKLREGDCITGRCERRTRDEMSGLASVIKVNGFQPDTVSGRPYFDGFTPIYADKKLSVGNSVTGRIIDLFAPIGAGQRVLLVSPPACGKTQTLKEIAKGIGESNKSTKIVIVLIDVSPEDAADFVKEFNGADVFPSTFDVGTAAHIRTMRLALEYCKRQTELSQDVVLIVDDLTRLIRACNSLTGRGVTGLDYSAVDSVKRMLASARNTESGASLTVISALSCGNGDVVEEAAYSALKDVFSVKITLSLSLARNRVYPPIDFAGTYSALDMRLLSESEMQLATDLKGLQPEKIFELFNKTSDNSQIIDILR